MNCRKNLFGTEITEIGLGCWQLGDAWGEVNDTDAQAILRASFDAGVRFFDTAAAYGGGKSERRIADFKASLTEAERRELFIATKITRAEASAAHIRASADQSSANLQMQPVDLLQLHCWSMEMMQQPGIWDALRQLKTDGRIRGFGASVESMEEARYCMAQEGLTTLQIIFNIYRQHPRDEIFAEAREKGVGLIVRVPLASGLLSGKFGHDTVFGEQDHRNFNRDGQRFHVGETFGGLPFEKGIALTDKLKRLLPSEPGMAQLALRWILDHPEVMTIIPGATSVAQAESNAAASELPPLPDSTHAQLAEFYAAEVSPHVRGQY